MSVSILVVDDEPDVAELFRQRFRREARQGTYVMPFADSGEAALERLLGNIKPGLIAGLSDINMPGDGRSAIARRDAAAVPGPAGDDGHSLWDDDRSRRASKLGAAQFLSKPVDFDLLKEQCAGFPPPSGNKTARLNDWLLVGKRALVGPGRRSGKGQEEPFRREAE
jgi:CheY-like chemotaxis protein